MSDGPAAVFAARLREARAAAGTPTYREMARRANWSHNGLSQADRGHRLPTWDCTRAYLRGLGVDDEARRQAWHAWWKSAHHAVHLHKTLAAQRERQTAPDRSDDQNAPPDPGHQKPGRDPVRRLTPPRLPREATIEDLCTALLALIKETGFSHEDIARRATRIKLSGNTAFRIPPDQLRRVLRREETPTMAAILTVVSACGGTEGDLRDWYTAWRRIERLEHRASEHSGPEQRALEQRALEQRAPAPGSARVTQPTALVRAGTHPAVPVDTAYHVRRLIVESLTHTPRHRHAMTLVRDELVKRAGLAVAVIGFAVLTTIGLATDRRHLALVGVLVLLLGEALRWLLSTTKPQVSALRALLTITRADELDSSYRPLPRRHPELPQRIPGVAVPTYQPLGDHYPRCPVSRSAPRHVKDLTLGQ